MELGDRRHHVAGASAGLDEADLQAALLKPQVGPHLRPGSRLVGDEPTGVRQQQLAGGRELGPLLGAHEKRRSEFALQTADLLAECGLRDKAGLGRLREVAQFGDGDEVAQVTDLHDPTIVGVNDRS